VRLYFDFFIVSANCFIYAASDHPCFIYRLNENTTTDACRCQGQSLKTSADAGVGECCNYIILTESNFDRSMVGDSVTPTVTYTCTHSSESTHLNTLSLSCVQLFRVVTDNMAKHFVGVQLTQARELVGENLVQRDGGRESGAKRVIAGN